MPQINKPNSYCHRLIRDTARSMAEEIYEVGASDNDWYEKYPDRKAYVKAAWPLLIEEARATLARLLTTPINEKLKEQISEALILDNTLRADRAGIRWKH